MKSRQEQNVVSCGCFAQVARLGLAYKNAKRPVLWSVPRPILARIC